MTMIYAIGDVHGCREPLDELLARIADQRRRQPGPLLFLGDYVDRGPSSREVVERVRLVADIALRGNHEEMLLAALQGSAGAERHWLANGGAETMASYGASDMEAFRERFPPDHRAFLASLALYHESEHCLFVHAGVRPGRALADQSAHDLLWIRDEFLGHPYAFTKRVVHGHTPNLLGPEVLPGRINVDTGCVKGGPLTCVVMDEGEVADIIQVEGAR